MEYKTGDLIEWGIVMTMYDNIPGHKGKANIKHTQVEITARVCETKKKRRQFAQATSINGWPWSWKSRRRQELAKAFRADTGMQIRGLEKLPGVHWQPGPPRTKITPEAAQERLRYLPLDRSLGQAPSYSVNACTHCGGTVHTDYDDRGEVRRCMACGRP